MYVSSDLNDPEPLTTSQLFRGRHIMSLPHQQLTKQDLTLLKLIGGLAY